MNKEDRPISPPINPNYQRKTGKSYTFEELKEGVLAGNRTLLARAITLVESTNPERRQLGRAVLEAVMPQTGRSMRIGITGVPGVGKSTFIEAIGRRWLDRGEKIAVLAVDPSSSRSRGSILGDKTRMPEMATHERVFIRPSPASGNLGGMARTSRETMLLCEAAGFDRILLETVGVGQSETTVHSMVDFFLLLMLPGAGDELQGMKRGVMEMADLIAINKAEEGNRKAAELAKRNYENALSLFPPAESGWPPKVYTCSALEEMQGGGLTDREVGGDEGVRGDVGVRRDVGPGRGEGFDGGQEVGADERVDGNDEFGSDRPSSTTGFDAIFRAIDEYEATTRHNGYFDHRRESQAIEWMHETILTELREQFYSDPRVKDQLAKIEANVRSGVISPFEAAQILLGVRKV